MAGNAEKVVHFHHLLYSKPATNKPQHPKLYQEAETIVYKFGSLRREQAYRKHLDNTHSHTPRESVQLCSNNNATLQREGSSFKFTTQEERLERKNQNFSSEDNFYSLVVISLVWRCTLCVCCVSVPASLQTTRGSELWS